MDKHMIDVNKASVEILENLRGIGKAKAEAIVSTRERLGLFHSVEEILQVPGIGRNLLEQNRDTLTCTLPATPNSPQTSTLRRSLRRCPTAASEAAKAKREMMINAGNRELSHHRSSRSGGIAAAAAAAAAVDSSSSSSRRSHHQGKEKAEGAGRGTKAMEVVEDEEEEEEEEDEVEEVEEEEEEEGDGESDEEKEEELLGLDFEEEKESELKDIVYAIRRSAKAPLADGADSRSQYGSDHGSDRSSSGHFRNENSIGGGLMGSDTPHEEGGISDTPLDVPLSPMRITDGELEMDNEEEDTEEDLEGRVVHEEEMMVVEQAPSQFPDKKQNKRKSEVCTDTKGACPVKKTCKAVDTSDGCERIKPSSQICHKLSPPAGLRSWLSKYQSWNQSQRLFALDSLIDICDLSQVRHIHQTILPQFQRDFISLLPKELALYVLSFLEPKDLLRAAQTCKYWNILAADNLLWREKCREAGLEDHVVVLNQRRKKGTSVSHMSPFKAAYMRQHRIEMNWRLNPLHPPRILKGHDDHVITCLQFSGNTVVSGSDDNTLKVWDATTGKCMRTLSGHTGGVWSSQMADNMIVSGSTDRMLRVWNATTGECIHTLYGHTSTVRCLHLHGKKVVSGSRDATLRVWDIITGFCEHVLMGHVAAVRCVQYNGKLVVSGAYDYMVKVWNPDREECLHTLQGHTNRVYSLQFDGVHVVSGSLDTSIRVWDVETGQCKHTLMGHQSLTSGMELKNNILISGNADSTVKVWDILTGQCLQTLSGPHKHRSAVTCLQFNNKFVVTSSDDGTVKLWDVKTGEFIRNLVALESGGSGGVVWRIRASDTKLVCAVGSRNGTEETKLLVLDFDVYESPLK